MLVLAYTCWQSAARAATYPFPSGSANASFCASWAHEFVDQVLVALFNAHAFAVEPIVTLPVTSDHESTSIRSTTETVEVVAHRCAFLLFLFLLIGVNRA
jgi:hypothetical protein